MNGSSLQSLLLRADASTPIGADHVMRCVKENRGYTTCQID